MSAISRDQLRLLAQEKIDDANLLFDHGRYSNAYYLYGYGVEFALKACISRLFKEHSIPEKRLVNDTYVHDLKKLVVTAKLDDELENREIESQIFKEHWRIVSSWSEQARYEMIVKDLADAIRIAVTDEENGVFKWLKNHW
jgi:HEPN domain-containing protein